MEDWSMETLTPFYYESTSNLSQHSLTCWQTISLKDIWIPSQVLFQSSKALSFRQKKKSQFHVLEKDDAYQEIPRFSFYDDSDTFESESDEEITVNSEIDICDTVEPDEKLTDKFLADAEVTPIQTDATTISNCVPVTSESPKTENINTPEQKKSNKQQLKLSPKIAAAIYDSDEIIDDEKDAINSNVSNSQNSLNDILDSTPEFDAKKIPLNENMTDVLVQELISMKLVTSNKGFDEDINEGVLQKKAKKQNKKEKQLKKRAAKMISIDALGDNDSLYNQQDDDRDCLAFVESVRRQNYFANGMHLNNTAEFPDLVKEKIVFNKPDLPRTEIQPEIGLQSVIDILVESSKSDETTNESVEETVVENEVIIRYGKIVIENIPKGVVEDDIKSLLEYYGVIKDLVISKSGKFLSASVGMEFNIDTDINWIIDCLDGTDPFASNDTCLKCYCVTENDS